jgi:predicted  nucleic acid-binding Zn-ribbon protein
MAEPSLELLQAMMQRMPDGMARMTGDVQEIRERLTTVENQLDNLVATEQSHYGQVMLRFDRHEARLDRIEDSLDLADAPAA